ncbi:MAG: J domain-containing protein [Acidimicrobiales bacterium]
MEIDEARRILGVDATADEQTLRAAHRRQIRRAHPDAGGSAAAAAGVNAAWALLRDHDPAAPPPADAGPRAPRPTPVSAERPPDVDGYYRVDVEPGELLARLAEAGHAVGEVVFVDPHGGILEIVVGEAPAVGQLAATVGATSGAGTEVAFTLEPLGVTPAPPIGPIVDALMAAVRR